MALLGVFRLTDLTSSYNDHYLHVDRLAYTTYVHFLFSMIYNCHHFHSNICIPIVVCRFRSWYAENQGGVIMIVLNGEEAEK